MKQSFARWIATVSWLGLSPIAPGTVASACAVASYIVLRRYLVTDMALLAMTGVLAVLGWWASVQVSRRMQHADPACVVIDEWVAVWVLCMCLPLRAVVLLAGLVVFRVFDIYKWGPVAWAERLPGAWGIMGDDFVAALMALATIKIVLLIGWL